MWSSIHRRLTDSSVTPSLLRDQVQSRTATTLSAFPKAKSVPDVTEKSDGDDRVEFFELWVPQWRGRGSNGTSWLKQNRLPCID